MRTEVYYDSIPEPVLSCSVNEAHQGQIEKHCWGLLDKEGEDTNHGYMKNSNQTCFTSFALIEDDPVIISDKRI